MTNGIKHPIEELTAASNEGELIAALSSKNAIERLHARRALVARGSSAVPALTRALEDRRDWVRWESAKALAQIGDPTSVPSFIRALKDRNPGVRWVGAEGLIAIGDDALAPLFHTLLEARKADREEDRDWEWLRDGVHHVCHALAHNYPVSEAARAVVRTIETYGSDTYLPLALERGLRLLEQRESQRSSGRARP
jgi:hypothetical protein